jgi:hypothetical protein
MTDKANKLIHVGFLGLHEWVDAIEHSAERNSPQ